jgi:hypothetical protein
VRRNQDRLDSSKATPACPSKRRHLNWSGRDGVQHWGGNRRPCRICGKPAFLIDDQGRPCHKVCAETEPDQG